MNIVFFFPSILVSVRQRPCRVLTQEALLSLCDHRPDQTVRPVYAGGNLETPFCEPCGMGCPKLKGTAWPAGASLLWLSELVFTTDEILHEKMVRKIVPNLS
jgi:hypothetical protein